MNDYEQELREKWSNISYQQGGSLELGIQHPLEWHVGYFSPEAKSIVIVSDEPVSKIESSKSIQASCMPRKDGRICDLLHSYFARAGRCICNNVWRYDSVFKHRK